MKQFLLLVTALGLSYTVSAQDKNIPNTTVPQIELSVAGTYESGIIDDSAAEVVAYDSRYKLAFVTNASENSIDVISIRRVNRPRKLFSIDLTSYGSPNSVAVKNGIVAVAVEAVVKQDLGSVVLFNRRGRFLNQFEVGALPDMLTFTPDGKKIITANEGEPNDDYTIDPEGSVSVITLSRPIRSMTQAAVQTVGFTAFNEVEIDPSIRIFGPGATVAQDLEPEYVAVSSDSTTAWVTLQENNALAVLDIASAKITALVGLGTKSFNTTTNAMDASDKDDMVNIRHWPVLGMYQPDSIAAYDFNGETFLVTANEGDARDYDGFSEEVRVDDLNLAPEILTNYPDIQEDDQLGRLKTTIVNGDLDGDNLVDQIYSYGARSFSIWTSAGDLVYDSGSDIARITAVTDPAWFNAADKRSDDKGAEPEAVTIGKAYGSTYAFIGLERTGGIMVYDISNPLSPYFVQYINNFDPSGDVNAGTAGDVAPEGLVFVPARKSPNRRPLLIVANEVSGTTTVYQINKTDAYSYYHR